MRYTLLAALISMAGCSGVGNGTPQASVARDFSSPIHAGKITHIIYIVQTGRSFDDLFQGYPGAKTSSTGQTSNGKTVALAPIRAAFTAVAVPSPIEA